MPTPREVADRCADFLQMFHNKIADSERQHMAEFIQDALAAREAAVWEQAKKLAQSTRGNGEVEAWNLGYAAACAYIEDQCEQRSRSGRGNPMTEAR